MYPIPIPTLYYGNGSARVFLRGATPLATGPMSAVAMHAMISLTSVNSGAHT